jgi:F-type H+-transporting ATPase subunit b
MDFNGTFLATIITFILFVLVMNKILYTPILGIMEKRKNFIDSNYKDAHENDEKCEVLSEEREAELNTAKNDARIKYLSTVDEFKQERQVKIESAQDAERAELERSNEELAHLSDEVKDGLKGSMANLASDIVEKVIGYRSEVQGFDSNIVDSVLWGGGK